MVLVVAVVVMCVSAAIGVSTVLTVVVTMKSESSFLRRIRHVARKKNFILMIQDRHGCGRGGRCSSCCCFSSRKQLHQTSSGSEDMSPFVQYIYFPSFLSIIKSFFFITTRRIRRWRRFFLFYIVFSSFFCLGKLASLSSAWQSNNDTFRA